MIVGTGIDLVDSRRIENLMKKHGDRFLERYFTPKEQAGFAAISDEGSRLLSISKRYAAKEACAKALGCGIRDGVYMVNMEVSNDGKGKPCLALTGGALAQMQSLTPSGMMSSIFLSLTDEPPLVQAQVIIEAQTI